MARVTTALETNQPRGVQSAKRRSIADRLAASPRGGIISRQQNTGFTVQHAIWYDLSDRVRPVCRTQAEQRSYIRDKKRAWRARAPEVDNPTPRQHEARGDIS